MSDFVSFFAPEPGAGPGTHQSRFENNPVARDRHPDGEISFTFEDFLDVINPLQHIPIVSWIYRAISGDEIGLAPRLIGGAMLGGPLGVLLAGAQACVEDMTGTAKEGGPVVALVRGLFGGDEDKDAAPAPALAAAAPIEPPAEISPAAGAIAAQVVSAAPIAPRPQPVSMPRGWGAHPQAHGSLMTPAAFARDAYIGPDDPRPLVSAPTRNIAAVPDHVIAAPDGARADWLASAMMRALDKSESARRLPRDETPKVSTVE
jgi:hypothetical protein